MNEEKRIVIVTDREEQLLSLACMFLRHGTEGVELYSDSAFIREPQGIDWLLTDQRSEPFVPQIAGRVFVLGKDPSGQVPGKTLLYEDQPTEQIYQELLEYANQPPIEEVQPECPKTTKLYLSMALAGGCGKTEGTLVLAKRLAQQGKEVLYINLEEEQDFGFFLDRTEKMTESSLEKPLEELLDYAVKKQDFSWIVPVLMEQSEEQMADQYIRIIREIWKMNRYDVILAEVPAKKDWYTVCLQEMIDKILVFIRQDAVCAGKLQILEKAKGTDMEYLYICGLHDKNRKNYLESMEITEYVPYTEEASVEGLLENGCMEATAEILR